MPEVTIEEKRRGLNTPSHFIHSKSTLYGIIALLVAGYMAWTRIDIISLDLRMRDIEKSAHTSIILLQEIKADQRQFQLANQSSHDNIVQRIRRNESWIKEEKP